MKLPKVVSQDEWLAARKVLLAKEKGATRVRDTLRAERQQLPMVRVDKTYTFDGPDGRVTLLDLFEGRTQLIVQHFMFDPAWDDGCPSCSYAVDDLGPGHLPHLHDKDTSYAVVSRAPLEKLEAWKAKKGWTLPWVSSYGSDFNYDFQVTFDERQGAAEINYRTKVEYEQRGFEGDLNGEHPGYSVFLRDGDTIYHTYSTYARGVEPLNSSTQFLDLTVLGR